MNRLQEIKDLIAQEAGYDDWKHLRTRVPLAYWDVYHDKAAQMYAREMCENQKTLCSEDLPTDTPELTIMCILDTPNATE